MAGFGTSFAQELFQEPCERGLAEGEARWRAEGKTAGESREKIIGEAIGRAIGEAIVKSIAEADGRAQGQAEALIRLLEKRFDPVPPHLCDRIYAADVMTIKNWFDRAIDALDLPSVFGAEAKGWSHPLEHETH